MSKQTFQEIIKQTYKILDQFESVEQRPWGIEGGMIELTKQVGELSQNVMMLEKYYLPDRDNEARYNKASHKEIGNELADILLIIIRIARHYNVDLEAAHMKELEIAQTEFDKKKA